MLNFIKHIILNPVTHENVLFFKIKLFGNTFVPSVEVQAWWTVEFCISINKYSPSFAFKGILHLIKKFYSGIGFNIVIFLLFKLSNKNFQIKL